ncbi:MAG: MFS transporter [Dehalococcoidia bacterium]
MHTHAPDPDVASELDPKRGFTRTFSALAYRDFRLLWFTQITNSAANWMQMVALPILVLQVTAGSELHLGLVMAARTAPAMVLGLFSGVMADMWNRKTILLITRFLVSALSVWFATVIVLGWVSLMDVYIFALIRGATMAFDQPPRRAMVPSIVPGYLVTNAMALMTGSVQIMRIVAAGVGGLMIVTLGAPSLFVALAVLYIIGIPLLLGLRVADHERAGYTGIKPVFRDIKESLQFAWSTASVRGVLIIAVLFFIFGIAFMQVFAPLLATGPMNVGEGGFGIMVALMGFGGTVGTLAIAYVNPSHNRGRILLTGMVVFGALLVLSSWSTYVTMPVLTYGLVLLLGMGHSLFQPLITTIMLQASPVNMRGRAMALLSYDRALVSMGAAVAGFTAAAVGPQMAQITFGLVCIGATLLLTLVYPALRRVD